MKKYLFWMAIVVLLIFGLSGNTQAVDQKITELPAATAMSGDDLFVIVDDPGGSPATEKITLANFLASLETVTFGAGNAITHTYNASAGVDCTWQYGNGTATLTCTTVAIAGRLSATTYGSDGTVTDAELLFINSLTSNAQDQLNAKAPIASPTFTGKATTAASAAVTGAGFNLPHGVAPNTPANGDCWTTSAGGLYCYINGATVGPYAIAATQAFLHIDDILTALGIASEAINFGTFTGTTIPDSSTAKAALQALETSLELKGTGTVTGTGTQYYLPVWTSTSAIGALSALGSAGNPLVSAGAGANPAWLAVVLAGGTNTFNISNGTASLDVAAGATVNIDYSLAIAGGAVTITGPSTFAVPGAAGNVMKSDGAGGWISSNTLNIASIETTGFSFIDPVGPTKKIAFSAVGILAGKTATLTFVNQDNAAYTFPATTAYLAPNPLTTIGDIPYANTTGTPAAYGRIAAVAAGSFLRSAGTGTVPAYSTSTFADTYVQGGLLHAATANTIAALAPGAIGSFLMSNGASAALTYLAAGAANYVLVGAGTTTIPVWTAATGIGAPVLGTSPTIDTPIITNPEVDGSTALSLTAAQVSGTIIYNTGQGVNDINHTLPEAAAGYSFVAFVGESQAAKYWRFTANTTPTPDDFMCLDGTCDKTYVSVAAPTRGNTLTCWTGKMASTGVKSTTTLAMATDTLAIKNAAFTFDASGTGYAKAIVDGTALAAGTIPQNTWGIYKYSIVAAGTITSTPGAANFTTGYADEAAAIAALPATPALSANMGYVTVTNTAAGGFIGGTTALNAGTVTAHYSSETTYTKPYNWICRTVNGTWTTN